MIEKEYEVQGKYQFDFSWILYLPIIILLAIVPLIVRFTPIDLDTEVTDILGKTQVVDFYTQFKSEAILIVTIGAIVILFLTFTKKYIKQDIYFNIYYIAIGIYIIMTLISTLMSDYKQIALWGIPERAEGMWIIGCYIFMLLYCSYIINNEKDLKYILIPLGVLVIALTILGISQYIGRDLLLSTEWGKQLIIPDKYSIYRDSLIPQYEEGKVYATMFHYNYVGSFGAMMVPLFMTLMLFIKGMRKKIVLGVLAFSSAFLLLGSTSRAGLIGLTLSVLVFIVVFARYLLKKWKLIVPCILLIIILLLGLNKVTEGTIFSRIPSLVNDAIALFIPSNTEFNYKEELPIQNIQHKDNKMFIKTLSGEIVLSAQGTNISFADEIGKEVVYIFENQIYSTQDPRFGFLSFKKLGEQNEERVDYGIYVNGQIQFYFRVQDQVHLINGVTLQDMELEDAPAIGFSDKLKLGSSRGYIWSRSLPMLKQTWLIGYGPDTYMLEFPQNDLLAKWYAYDTTNMVVSKPHNLYLQMALNQGAIALIAFLVLIGAYLVQSIKLFACRAFYKEKEILGIGIMLAIVGYLGAGIFNDSEISVAPIFWILLGSGMALNYIIQQEETYRMKKASHGVITMQRKRLK